MNLLALLVALPLGLARAPGPKSPVVGAHSRAATADELHRLRGQAVEHLAGDRYRIASIAGEGPPRIGVIERRGAELWLVEPGGAAHRLAGPLAIPRIAGPGYTVWVVGDLDAVGALRARRLGVLARPGGHRSGGDASAGIGHRKPSRLCSTPEGIGAAVTTPSRRITGSVAACSTPEGIGAAVTIAERERPCGRYRGAQRPKASERR